MFWLIVAALFWRDYQKGKQKRGVPGRAVEERDKPWTPEPDTKLSQAVWGY
jgi:hypothetical protein